jgi:DNA-binding NtrC family response regulator
MIADRILIADRDEEALRRLGDELATHGYEVVLAPTAATLAHCLAEHGCDIVLIDIELDGDGLAAARNVRSRAPETRVIVMAEPDRVADHAAELLTHHCALLHKPVNTPQLLIAVDQAASLCRLRHENRTLRQQWEDSEAPGDFVSHNPLMIDLLRQAATAADTDEPVIICGPAGTETDIVALYIHRCSRRSDRPFVRFQCHTAEPDEQADALFGSEHVAPDGVAWRSHGLLDLATGGTLFIENVHLLSSGAQAQLLRFIEEAEGLRGTPRVRILCSAELAADEMDQLDRLRQDLLFRLNTFSLNIPPLSERREDVLPLAQRFRARFARALSRDVVDISDAATELLEEYDWPGNTRELRHAIQAAVCGAHGRVLAPEDLLRGPSRRSDSVMVGGVTGPSIEDAERQLILITLQETDHNKTETARRLGISMSSLCNRLARYRSEGLLPATAHREAIHA